MVEKLNIIFEKIAKLKKDIDKIRPISAELESKIMQKFRLDWNFHSNCIEGNQLTYGETKSLILHGITANGKPLKDHLEIKGHNEALLLLEDVAKEKRMITENFIRELHILILKEPYYTKAQTLDEQIVGKKIEIGKYKTQANHVKTITGEMFYFASPEETPAKMYDLINWYRESVENKENQIITASLFHYKFVRIHPFDDGNGRLARILMNLILMQDGFLPVIIKQENKNEYFRALQQADGGDATYFISYIANELVYSMQWYLRAANGENIEENI